MPTLVFLLPLQPRVIYFYRAAGTIHISPSHKFIAIHIFIFACCFHRAKGFVLGGNLLHLFEPILFTMPQSMLRIRQAGSRRKMSLRDSAHAALLLQLRQGALLRLATAGTPAAAA